MHRVSNRALSGSEHKINQPYFRSVMRRYLRLIGNKSRSDDYKPSQWDKWNADMALGWTPDKDTWLELTAGQGDGEARYAGRSMDGSQFKRESLEMRVEKSNIGDVFDKFEASTYYNYADHTRLCVTTMCRSLMR